MSTDDGNGNRLPGAYHPTPRFNRLPSKASSTAISIVWVVDLCTATKARILAAESVQPVGPAQPLDDGLDVSKVDRVGVVVLHEQPWIGRDAHLSVSSIKPLHKGVATAAEQSDYWQTRPTTFRTISVPT